MLKKYVCFSILVILMSCVRSEEKSFENCLTQKEKEQFGKLRNSFVEFINLNFQGSTNNYLEWLKKGTNLIEFKFSKNDELLFRQMQRDSFLNFAYDHIPIETYWKDLPKERRKILLEESKGKSIWHFNYFKKYINCLNSIENKDTMTIAYLEAKHTLGELSPANLGEGLSFNTKNKENTNQKLLDYILIIETYYFILKNEFE